MTADLGDQMRELCAFIEEEQGSITVDDVRARTGDVPVSPRHAHSHTAEITIIDESLFDLRQPGESAAPTLHRRRAVAGALAAAAVTLVLAIVVTDSNDGNVVTDAVSSPTVVEPVAPPAVADPGSSPWTLAFNSDGRSEMHGVIAGGPGFVAVGSRDGNAAVWTSVDGLTWSRVPHDEAVFREEGDEVMMDVTVGGPGLVAIGYQDVATDYEVAGKEDPFTDHDNSNAVVWTSVDGLTWSRVPQDESVFGGRQSAMSSVTTGGPGLVAVGWSDDSADGGEFLDGNAVVWTSEDGLTWTRVPHDESVFGGEDEQVMLDVTVGGPGLIAVGKDGRGAWDNSEHQDAAVWTSIDGFTWTRVPHDEATFGGDRPAMLSVTPGGPGLVAVGYSFGHSAPAAVWTSVDGLTWSRVSHDNRGELSGTMWSVTTGGPGLVAVGQSGNGSGVWTSNDGLTWSLVAQPDTEAGRLDGSRMLALNSANGSFIAVGSLHPYLDSQTAAAWTSPNP